eukprot:3399964-Amphidinium_carterae.1
MIPLFCVGLVLGIAAGAWSTWNVPMSTEDVDGAVEDKENEQGDAKRAEQLTLSLNLECKEDGANGHMYKWMSTCCPRCPPSTHAGLVLLRTLHVASAALE